MAHHNADRAQLEALLAHLTDAERRIYDLMPDSVKAEVHNALKKHFAPTKNRIVDIMEHLPDNDDGQRTADDEKKDGNMMMQDFELKPISLDDYVKDSVGPMLEAVSNTLDQFDIVAVPKQIVVSVMFCCYCYSSY